MADRRTMWTPERRARFSETQKAMWARKKRQPEASPRRSFQRRVGRPFLDVYEECIAALETRQRQFLRIAETVSETFPNDGDVYEDAVSVAVQDRAVVDFAVQALREAIRRERGIQKEFKG